MSNRTVLIFGAGGHARVIASLLDQPSRFVDKDDEPAILANLDLLLNADVYLGIGDNISREPVFNRLCALGATMPPFVARGAVIARGVEIGRGTVILPGAVVMTGVRLGEDCIVDLLSSIDHDSSIGPHTFIGPGVTIPGRVEVGARCFFGVKSATFPAVKIGDRSVIRAGSLVTKDVKSGTKVGGVPAVEVSG